MNEKRDEVAAAIDRNFTSRNVANRNFEDANAVDALEKIAHFIAVGLSAPMQDLDGDFSGDPERRIGVPLGLAMVARAIHDLAAALRGSKK